MVALCPLPTEKWIWKKLLISKQNCKEKGCESCGQWSVHCKTWNKNSLTKAKERATSADDCRRMKAGVSVQQYSIQCKGYNLFGVTTVEVSTTRGATALVYWQLNSSLYTSVVQGYWSTPNWSDRRQGCRQVSTQWVFIFLQWQVYHFSVVCNPEKKHSRSVGFLNYLA